MKCVLLAAGYATRLYPLTKDCPKSLLPIGSDTILGFILGKIEQVELIDQVFIVSNDRFYGQFTDWVSQYPATEKITVLNDGTATNDTRLGAIADLQFAIQQGAIDDDILVMAGDNLFDFSLADFIAFFQQVDHDCITAHSLADLTALRRTGVVEIDNEQRVMSFEEKPQSPKSNMAVPPFYLYKQATLPLLDQYLAAGNNPDAPGNFLPWLIARKTVYTYLFQGNRYDIGNLESYQQACRIFARQ